MAKVTGFTAARMLAIEMASVVAGVIQDGNLILTKRDGTPINAGNVRGPAGPQGIPGSIEVSPAGGVLQGNYPNPGLAAGVVNNSHIAAQNKDGAADLYSMRTLGTGPLQAAAGDHKHGDAGWIGFTGGSGEAPFASVSTVRSQYRKFGPLVHVRITKTSTAARDTSTNTTGDFANVNITAVGAVPVVARPDTQNVNGTASINNTPVACVLTPAGTIIWIGGFPRNYASGSILTADFLFMTTN